MYPHQLDRLSLALEQAGLDALVATTPENVAYVTGRVSPAPRWHRATERFAVFSRRGTALVVPTMEAGALAADPADVDHVRCHGPSIYTRGEGATGEDAARVHAWTATPSATAADALAQALAALDLGGGRVGVDEAGLSVTGWARLVEGLGPGRVTEGARHLAAARTVKGPYEIECLQRALGVAEEAVNAVVQILRPGTTEREAADLLQAEIARRGAVLRWGLVTFGARTALSLAPPTATALRPGDLVRFDVGCGWRGYAAALGRAAVMGEPDDRQAARAQALTAVVDAGIDAIRPGTPATKVFEAAMAAARDAGLPLLDGPPVGHGIGLEPWEPPVLGPDDATPLEIGTILLLDAGYHEPGWGSLQFRDTVLVTSRGTAALNRSARGLVVLD